MKLLFLSGFYPPLTKGGGELSTHYIAQALVKRGHMVRVITGGDTQEEQIVDGVSVLRLPLPFTAKPLFEKRWSKRMARKLKNAVPDMQQYDIIHAHDFRMAQILSELKLPPSIVTARDYAQICGTTNHLLADGEVGDCCSLKNVFSNNPRVNEASVLRKPFRIWQYAYNRRYRLKSFRCFQHQIFISKAQRDLIGTLQDLSSAQTHIIYNPVLENYLKPTSVKAVPLNVLYVGRVEFYKGVGLLLRAWKTISKEFPQAHLKIVGDGAQRREYQQFVERERLQYSVSFTGHVPFNQLIGTYDQASVVVAPHLWVEPFGRAVVEAMARGKVVVAANAGGPSEVIKNNVTGFLFERGSAKDLITKLRASLIMNDVARRDMQEEAREWVSANLNPTRIAAQYESVYRTLS